VATGVMLRFGPHMAQDRNTAQPADPAATRPLTARSVVASTLLGVDPPVLPVRVLVRSGELFGIAEGTTRVALSRMVAAGELVADGDGRYRLAGHLLERQRRQRESRRAPGRASWRGEWRLAIVAGDGRREAGERAALRAAMARARYGELREGVWARPDNLDAGTRLVAGAEALTWATARFDDDGSGGGAAIAARLWDLTWWADRARALERQLDRWSPALARHDLDALPGTFVLSAAVLRHFQADPLLPPPLLPHDWPGRSLRERYDAFDALFVAVWRDWHRAFVKR
jgi:phenylacetic acid degradation operon negative regulatory protein